MSLGVECLLTDSAPLAEEMASELDDLNKERRQIEADMQEQAQEGLAQLELSALPKSWGVCLYNSDWHQGVSGILASRIKDKMHRPVIVFAPDGKGGLKGSARSIAGLHIKDALDAVARQAPHLLCKFGGHAMAAGLSIQPEHLEAFTQQFEQVCQQRMSEDDLQQVIYSDGELTEKEFTLDLAHQLKYAMPWGQKFSVPMFDNQFYVHSQRLVGERHLKLVLSVQKNGRRLEAIAFNVELDKWPNAACLQVHCAYHLEVNVFRGQTVLQLLVRYLKRVDDV
jgi:single-stranded-DNA-specific exonuclease